jgi:hypothetical protein
MANEERAWLNKQNSDRYKINYKTGEIEYHAPQLRPGADFEW